jgi:hypothetical protein
MPRGHYKKLVAEPRSSVRNGSKADTRSLVFCAPTLVLIHFRDG